MREMTPAVNWLSQKKGADSYMPCRAMAYMASVSNALVVTVPSGWYLVKNPVPDNYSNLRAVNGLGNVSSLMVRVTGKRWKVN